MMSAKSKNKLLLMVILAFAVFGFYSIKVNAVSAEYSQSYTSDNKLSFGTLVSLVDNSENKIEPTSISNAKNYLGVYVANEGSILAINKQNDGYQVAVSGNTIALVSDENGDIKKGDKLAISKIDGVASKALSGNNVVGVAAYDFDESSSKNSVTQVNLADGSTGNVVIGPMEMEIYTVKKDVEVKPGLIGWVERLTGKEVTPFKILVALLITILLFFCVTAMATSATRNTIIQASRNPLAKPVIMRALVRIFMFIAIISIIGVVLIYVVLRA